MRFRVSVCVVATCFSLYALITASFIAEAGVTYHIDQLMAAGAAELMISVLGLAASAIALWKLTWSAYLFGATAIWSILVAFVYGDTAVWIWGGGYAILTFVNWWLGRKNKCNYPSSILGVQSRSH